MAPANTGGAKMFTNLIESQSHRKEFKRRSSFVLVTVAAYAVILFGAGIASIYAYDAKLEAQTSGLELLNWVPPVTTAAPKPLPDRSQPVRRTTTSNAPVDRHVDVPIRTEAIARTGNPTLTPAAKEAAMRARFTPTILNGQPVKIQGVIIYNFVLQ